MKNRIKNYVFTPGAAGVGTLQLTDYPNIDKAGILLIVNETTGVFLYNFSESTMLGTVSGNTITLMVASNGGGATSGDRLLIYYEDGIFASDLMVVGATGQTIATNNAVLAIAGSGALDCLGFRSAAVQVISTGTSGFYVFEGSNDGINWQTMPVANQVSINGTIIVSSIAATVSNIVYAFPITTRYLRLRIVTTITGGSIQTFTKLSTTSHVAMTTTVSQNNTTSLAVDTELVSFAITDAQSNPTTAVVGALGQKYNGTSWDRERNNMNTTTGDAGAKTATFTGALQVNFNARGAIITCLFGAVTGTTPTIAMQLQWSPDGGTTWLNFGPSVAPFTPVSGNTATFVVYPTQLSEDTTTTLATFALGATQSKAMNAPLPRSWRIVYTIGGTTPSITITGVYINYLL